MSEGYIKLRRTAETLELLKDHNAFVLLTVIALRARRTGGFSVHGLAPGEALIGDHASYGMSERQYRSAKKRLTRYGFADFKATNKGTVATLVDTYVYDINEAAARQAGDDQATNERRTRDEQTPTNKNEKNEKNGKHSSCHAEALRLSALLLELIVQRKPDLRRPKLDRWACDIDQMIRLDDRTPERIEAVIRWCQSDPFWQNTILSTAKLRRHFDGLELRMRRHGPHESTRDMVARMEREGKL